MLAVFGSGALAGLALFSVQHFTVIALIQAAETYETAHSGAAHEDVGWQPTGGWERISFRALTTMLTGIGFAAMLFGVMALAGETINTRHGAVWGLAAFGCFSLAPALGLPPQPPGVAVADLHQRQLWWAGTVIATAIGVVVHRPEETKLAPPNLWSCVLVASTPGWRTCRHRREQCSGSIGPPVHNCIGRDQRHILARGRCA